jgi:hypothetical protein
VNIREPPVWFVEERNNPAMILSDFPCTECGERHQLSKPEVECHTMIPLRQCPNMRAYVFHWRHGEPETLRGRSPADALNRAGYGRGAVAALDYYEEAARSVLGGQ